MVCIAHNKEQVFCCMKMGPGGPKSRFFCLGSNVQLQAMPRGQLLGVPREGLNAELLREFDSFDDQFKRLSNDGRGKPPEDHL